MVLVIVILIAVIGHKHISDGTKTFRKGRTPGLFDNFGQFLCFWIRIRHPNTDPDPDSEINAYQCWSGFGSTTLAFNHDAQDHKNFESPQFYKNILSIGKFTESSKTPNRHRTKNCLFISLDFTCGIRQHAVVRYSKWTDLPCFQNSKE